MQVRTLTAVNQIGHEDHPQLNTTIIAAGRDDGEQGHHVRHQKQQQRADQHAEAGEQQAAHRNAGTARQDTKLPVRMLLHRQAVQHAGAGEDPLLAEDIAEVSATKLITAAAAAARPWRTASRRAGLRRHPGHEATAMITTIDSR